ncbi:BrnT family toxin [Candidatus Gottesmanbacteria bacterium]|nr:BrnT family toxin [Candidatus Gottesmanbacteria bacterium]
MQIKTDEVEFDWDEGNLDKSRRKQGVVPEEAESVFLDEKSLIVEERFIIVGKSSENRNLFIVFTVRKEKIRIISARRMHKKEVEKYEEIKKNTKI